MKIAITGGLGFIGQKLARRLVQGGHEPILIDSLTSQIHGELPSVQAPEGTRAVRLDVRELAERHELLDGCEAIYHLAAETGTAQSMYQIQRYVGVNELGTAALLEAIARCERKPRLVVLASSRSVYGEGAYEDPARPGELRQPLPRTASQLAAHRWDHMAESGQILKAVPTPEALPFVPGSVYAASKAAQEMLLMSAASAMNVRCAILRFQNVYGEGQSLRNPYTGIISIFYNRARQGLEIPIYEDGLESRDFVHVDDVTSALSRALECDLPRDAVVNVGSGHPTSVLELATTLLDSASLKVPVRVTGQYRVGDIRHCFADVSRLEKYLGLRPTVSLSDGLKRFCAWASKEPVHEDKLDAATRELRAKGLA